MSLPKVTARMTFRDLWEFPENGNRYELIDGEIYVSPPPGEAHQRASVNLAAPLSTFVKERELGRVYYNFGVIIDPPREDPYLIPDLIFVSKKNLGKIKKNYFQGGPDLVVEIRSPSTATYDRVTKRALYERAGVRELLLIDPHREEVEIFRLRRRKLSHAATLSSKDWLELQTVPGFRMKVADLFE